MRVYVKPLELMPLVSGDPPQYIHLTSARQRERGVGICTIRPLEACKVFFPR